MAILIIPAVGSADGFGEAFESFARDVVLKHGHVAQLNYIPLGQSVWGYQVTGDTSVLMRCHATPDPVDKVAVSAFLGEFAVARQHNDRLVGVLVSTNGFTSERSNSARAFYEDIRKGELGGNFHLYDPDEMFEIVSAHRRLLSVEELAARVKRATGSPPVAQDLVLTRGTRFWLVELGGADAGSFLLMESMGDLMSPEAVKEAPLEALRSLRPQLRSMECVANQRYLAEFPRTGTMARPTEPSSDDGLLALVESDRRLRQQVDALVKSSRSRLCPERGDSICHEFERVMLTFFDHIAPVALAEAASEGQRAADASQNAAAIVAAVRIGALYLASSWIHRTDPKILGTPAGFVDRLTRSANFRADWMRSAPGHTEIVVRGVIGLMDHQDQPTRGTFGEIAGLSGHLAAAFGPFCSIYRTTLHQQLLPDEVIQLPNTPRLDTVWTERASQQLNVGLSVPTPRIHRHVVANRTLLQLAVERVEDTLGRAGEMLHFTRVNVSTNNADFEQIECYFELESEHILKIFMGEELYASKDVWLRELLQNAIDATLLRKVLLDEADYQPQVVVVHDKKRDEVQVADNGVGMSLYHVRKFFSKVGRSYYRSSELEDVLREHSRTFSPISRFGVGFLSVFMVAKSAEILTSHVNVRGRDGGLSILIPALMEDFYIRRNEQTGPGTKVILELGKSLDVSVEELVRRYILRPSVDICVMEDGRTSLFKATGNLSIVPNVVDDAAWSSSFRMISASATGQGFSAVIGVLIPRFGGGGGDRRSDPQWHELPKTRLAFAQAGIWVKDDNEFFGERRGHGGAYHPYFKRLYGIIDFEPGTLKMSVSRNEFVVDEAAGAALKRELLTKTIAALVEAVDTQVAQIAKVRERNEYLRAILLGAIEDGEEYYWVRNRTAAQLRYSNSEVLTTAMAGLFAKHFVLEHRAVDQTAEELTVRQVVDVWTPGQEMFYTLVSDIDQDPLFKAWLTEQPVGTRVFFAKSKREASLLISAFRVSGYKQELRELTRKQLQMAIHFEVVRSPLDKHLLAAAGIVEFGQYKPTTVILPLPPTSQGAVSKAVGLVNMRAECPEDPFVLIDAKHWFPQFLIFAAELAEERDDIRTNVREVCQVLVVNVALGDTIAVRREGLQALNNRLTRLYASIDGAGKSGDNEAIQRRSMLTMAELMGNKR